MAKLLGTSVASIKCNLRGTIKLQEEALPANEKVCPALPTWPILPISHQFLPQIRQPPKLVMVPQHRAIPQQTLSSIALPPSKEP